MPFKERQSLADAGKSVWKTVALQKMLHSRVRRLEGVMLQDRWYNWCHYLELACTALFRRHIFFSDQLTCNGDDATTAIDSAFKAGRVKDCVTLVTSRACFHEKMPVQSFTGPCCSLLRSWSPPPTAISIHYEKTCKLDFYSRARGVDVGAAGKRSMFL